MTENDPKQTDSGSKRQTGWERVQRARQERLVQARAALVELDDGELTELLCDELSRRRLDTDGNPKEPPGLYRAVTNGIAGLLGQRLLDDLDAAMVAHLAAVGRGAVTEKDTAAADIREIASWVEAICRHAVDDARLQMLTRFFEERFGRGVDLKELREVLTNKNKRLNGKLTDIGVAVGIYPKKLKSPDTKAPEKLDPYRERQARVLEEKKARDRAWRRALDRVRTALAAGLK